MLAILSGLLSLGCGIITIWVFFCIIKAAYEWLVVTLFRSLLRKRGRVHIIL